MKGTRQFLTHLGYIGKVAFTSYLPQKKKKRNLQQGIQGRGGGGIWLKTPGFQHRYVRKQSQNRERNGVGIYSKTDLYQGRK